MKPSEISPNPNEIKAMLYMVDDLGDESQWIGQEPATQERIQKCEWDDIHGDIISF